MTALAPVGGQAMLYDDTDYKDRTVKLNIDYDYYVMINNLKDHDNFNDKTSAIRVSNYLIPNYYYRPSYAEWNYSELGGNLRTCLIGFSDSDYSGDKLYCIANYSSTAKVDVPETWTHQDWKLRNIGWNDKISSVVFRIITVNNINSGIYTPHDPV